MNPQFQQIITQTIRRHLGKGRADKISDYAIARQSLKLKVTATRLFKDIVFISLGILSAGFGLKGFLLPNGFIDGGVTGISLLIEALVRETHTLREGHTVRETHTLREKHTH